jgi:hypothetical protein
MFLILTIASNLLFQGLCQLFELYFFTVFKVFGNRDYLSAPLKSALVRISQDLEEQRVQLPSSPTKISSTGLPISPGQMNVPAEPMSPYGGTMFAVNVGNLFALKVPHVDHKVLSIAYLRSAGALVEVNVIAI